MIAKLFQPAHGYTLIGFILGTILIGLILVGALMAVPPRFRRNIILLATFVGGLFYALEFFLPTHKLHDPADPTRVGNFLTPYVVPFGDITNVIFAWTVGLGVINLFQVHGKRIIKGASGSFNSVAFFLAMGVMLVINILQQAHPNAINKNLNALLFDGGLQSLDATMFSIIAFYIVSAAYRAFRVRSFEATLLLVTAVIVMLGQIALGQWLTHRIDPNPNNFVHNFRIEIIRDWIMTKANAPATRAVAFGLGIGGLAVALRIWLGLERGSYFESQG